MSLCERVFGHMSYDNYVIFIRICLALTLLCAAGFLIKWVSILQKELVFPAVIAVLDVPPTFIYHQCYYLVRDDNFKQFCWSIMGNGREDSGVRDSG